MRTVEYLESEAEHFNLLPDTLKLSFFLREKNEPCQRSAVALPSPLLSLCKSDSFLTQGNGTPLQYSCLENPMDGGAW